MKRVTGRITGCVMIARGSKSSLSRPIVQALQPTLPERPQRRARQIKSWRTGAKKKPSTEYLPLVASQPPQPP